jgi:hypothetical protein
MTTGAGDMVIWKGREIPAHIPGLSCDNKHRYFLNGRRLNGVTDYISKYQDHSFCNEIDLKWGEIAHDYWYKQDMGILDFDSPEFDHRFDARVAGWIKFKKDHGFDETKMLAEWMLNSEKYLFAGRFDNLFETQNYDYMIDKKSGNPSSVTGLQLAGYGLLAIEHGLTNKTRLKLMEVCINQEGYCKPQMFDYKTEINYFLMAYSLQNHLTK